MKLVDAEPGADAASLIEALGLAAHVGQPVLVVASGSGSLSNASHEDAPAIGAVVSAAAALTGATVVDDGTTAGVSLPAGAAPAEEPGDTSVLLGIAPAGAAVEPHHTHVVRADPGGHDRETDLMFAIAAALADTAPAALVVAGGDDVATAQALGAVERRWPVFVLAGTGGTADAIATEWQRRHPAHAETGVRRWLPRRLRRSTIPELSAIPDPGLRRIVGEGSIAVLTGSEVATVVRPLVWKLHTDAVLKNVWITFATYDALAGRVRKSFERVQSSILALGVLATLLALLANATGIGALHWAAVAAPIVVSTVIALANRRAAGKRWVVLRAAAEAMKAEIYRYRTRTGLYADARLPDRDPTTRAQVFADRISSIEGTLMHTDASSAALDRYAGPLPPLMYGASREDDGLSRLSATGYLRFRVGDQLNYFEGRVKKLDRRREILQALGVGAGGAGAIVAAAGAAVWVGLTTAISGAALSYLAYLQVDSTIVTYNQAAGKLRRLARDWDALTPARHDEVAFEHLVTDGETVLGLELGGWVRQMTQAVDRVQAQQAEPERGRDHEPAPRETPATTDRG